MSVMEHTTFEGAIDYDQIMEDGQLMRQLKAEIRGLPVKLIVEDFAPTSVSVFGPEGIGMAGKQVLARLWRRILLEANQGV